MSTLIPMKVRIRVVVKLLSGDGVVPGSVTAGVGFVVQQFHPEAFKTSLDATHFVVAVAVNDSVRTLTESRQELLRFGVIGKIAVVNFA